MRWFSNIPPIAGPGKTQEELLLEENAHLKLQNALLLKEVGKRSEYR